LAQGHCNRWLRQHDDDFEDNDVTHQAFHRKDVLFWFNIAGKIRISQKQAGILC
jgi:hypothetical protein